MPLPDNARYWSSAPATRLRGNATRIFSLRPAGEEPSTSSAQEIPSGSSRVESAQRIALLPNISADMLLSQARSAAVPE